MKYGKTRNGIRTVTFVTAVLATSMIGLTGCVGGAADSPETSPELSPQERFEQENDVSVTPGLATCKFNNELEDYEADGSGVSPYPELATAEIRETPEAYEVTFTGDFFDPDELIGDRSTLNLHLMLIGEDPGADSPTLLTEYSFGELDLTGTYMGQSAEAVELETSPKLEEGKFHATYPKDSPHLENFTPAEWVASVSYSENIDNEEMRPAGFRCADGRNLRWEPATQ